MMLILPFYLLLVWRKITDFFSFQFTEDWNYYRLFTLVLLCHWFIWLLIYNQMWTINFWNAPVRKFWKEIIIQESAATHVHTIENASPNMISLLMKICLFESSKTSFYTALEWAYLPLRIGIFLQERCGRSLRPMSEQ